MAKALEFEKAGLAFYKNKKDADAISAYEKALEVYANGSIYFNYGNSLWNMGNLDLAIRSYEIAELLNYERKDLLYYNLACAYSKKEMDRIT
ncbi:tetratricopeptide repeat protein, partial [Leptospira interrogans serovar Bataviae str. UI 08561]